MTSRSKKYLKIAGWSILGLGAAGFIFVLGLFVYYSKDLPNPGKVNKRVVAESTKIYDRTGEHLLYEIHGEEKRTIIPFSDMPDAVKSATITLEDQGFYSHYGVDFRGILRSVLKDVVKGGLAQGGSTITQQFVKNSILTNEKRFSRKIKEVILAIEIERKFSKDEILQMYLNEIPYGSNAYGVEAAAETYFGKPANELTLAQSALLASLPQAPTYYSPHGSHTDALIGRWQHSLNEMANLGYISPEQAEQAKKENILAQIKPLRANIQAPHFVMYVKDQLVAEFGEDEIEKNGMKVYTTLDWELQKLAEKSVKEGVEKNGAWYKFNNAALVAINPRNGQIIAMVGSKDYFDESIDGNVNVAIRDRQPGSSFKPYVYAEAFTKGYTPETIIYDVDTNFSTDSGKDYNPKNYDNQNRGPLKMKEALAMSLNVPAVKTLYLAGVKDSIELARSMGITTLNNPSRYGLALVLGGGEVKLLDHAVAFSVFANKGIKQDKTAIIKIEDSSGSVVKSFEETKGQQVLDKNVALQVCDILSNNDLRAPVFGTNNALVISGRKVAAKTGTTNEWRDGWLVGATPSLAAGVWAGNNDNTPMAQGADGSYVAGPIWNAFMSTALKDTQVEDFEKPQEIKTGKPILDGTLEVKEEVKVCKDKNGDYCLDNGYCSDSERKKRILYNNRSILYYVDRKDPAGELPTEPEKDPQFENWEKAVKKWVEGRADGKDLLEKPKECKKGDLSEKKSLGPDISIVSPEAGQIIKDTLLIIRVESNGGAALKQVDFFVDGEAIGSRRNGVFEINYPISYLKDGKNMEILARGFDEEGNRDEDKITVSVQLA